MKRKIVHIDEDKCDGCGLCVPRCHEGAIRIVGGKARLVAENLCDGLGDCLGECPRGAITIVERNADSFDETAVHRHLAQHRNGSLAASSAADRPLAGPSPCDRRAPPPTGGCPGARARVLAAGSGSTGGAPAGGPVDSAGPFASRLGHWPIKLELIRPGAPFLSGADLLLTADCAAAAIPSFNERFLRGRALALSCPKLGPREEYLDKLAAILRVSGVRSLIVVHMEVPCCAALVALARQAIADSGAATVLETVRVGLDGQIQARETVPV